ncbi:hypothetical protein [Halocalculus aciditolerans]|uniref:hypothetical protein n=1 Tax=Halocalculus aciditolerans TaxID=1383812 RepID=UPI0016672E8D|nr:hypothetical protein [Halocalculus aciditolerans]
MFGTPPCPECGSAFLVVRLRTHGYPRTESGSVEKYYRCFRCFHSFSEDETATA